jgi:hypothetical protein
MKSYEILPAGMAGAAKEPKPYEILPGAGTAAQGLGGWTKGAAAFAQGRPMYGASSARAFGQPCDPPGLMPASGGGVGSPMGRPLKSYEILPGGGVTAHDTERCSGNCGVGSMLRPPSMLPRRKTPGFVDARPAGPPGGASAPILRAEDFNRLLVTSMPSALTCFQLWERYRALANQYVNWQWARSMIKDARDFLRWLQQHTTVSPHQRACCDVFSRAAEMIAREMILFSSGRTSQERDINFRLDRLFWTLHDLTSLCQQTIDQTGQDDGLMHTLSDMAFQEALDGLDAQNAGIEPEIHEVIDQMMAMECNLPDRYFWGRPAP